MAILLGGIDDYSAIANGMSKSEELLFHSQKFIEGSYGQPYCYRLLMPSILIGYNSLSIGLSIHHFAFIFEVLMLLGCQWAMFRLLRHYVPKMSALMGVLLMNVILGYMLNHIAGMTLVELIDIFNLLVLLVMLITVIEKRFYWLIFALGIGMLNRETPLIILPAIGYFMYKIQWNRRQIILVMMSGVFAFVGLRWFISSTEVPFQLDKMAYNIPFLDMSLTSFVIKSNIRFLLLVGPLLFLAFWKLKELPLFIRLLVYTSIPFIILHYFVGTIMEARLWMPLIVLLLPAVVLNLRSFLDRGC